MAWVAWLMASAIGCDDASRCANFCNRVAECSVADVISCETKCEDSLASLDEGACNEAASDYYNCMSFRSCMSIEEGEACKEELQAAVDSCPGGYEPIGGYTTLP